LEEFRPSFTIFHGPAGCISAARYSYAEGALPPCPITVDPLLMKKLITQWIGFHPGPANEPTAMTA